MNDTDHQIDHVDAQPMVSTPLRRLSAELRGDAALEANVLETILRIQETARTKVERDSELVRLAIRALSRSIEVWRRDSGRTFPTAAELDAFLEK